MMIKFDSKKNGFIIASNHPENEIRHDQSYEKNVESE